MKQERAAGEKKKQNSLWPKKKHFVQLHPTYFWCIDKENMNFVQALSFSLCQL